MTWGRERDQRRAPLSSRCGRSCRAWGRGWPGPRAQPPRLPGHGRARPALQRPPPERRPGLPAAAAGLPRPGLPAGSGRRRAGSAAGTPRRPEQPRRERGARTVRSPAGAGPVGAQLGLVNPPHDPPWGASELPDSRRETDPGDVNCKSPGAAQPGNPSLTSAGLLLREVRRLCRARPGRAGIGTRADRSLAVPSARPPVRTLVPRGHSVSHPQSGTELGPAGEIVEVKCLAQCLPQIRFPYVVPPDLFPSPLTK